MNLPKKDLEAKGFAFVPHNQTEKELEKLGLTHASWNELARSWNDLGEDRYMADGGRYRRRRYGVFSITRDDGLRLKPHQPHYQSRDYNVLNGGVERWFLPLLPSTRNNPALKAILKFASRTAWECTAEGPPESWHVEIHQFRIEANRDMHGSPSPEGMHRDGVDWVFVFLVNRTNVIEGTTSICALDQKTVLGSFTLTAPLDCAIVNDHRVYHGVTPIQPENPALAAHRDVLVVTLRRE